jgi:hypothetical protein
VILISKNVRLIVDLTFRHLRAVPTDEAKAFAEKNNLSFIETSALGGFQDQGDGFDYLFVCFLICLVVYLYFGFPSLLGSYPSSGLMARRRTVVHR